MGRPSFRELVERQKYDVTRSRVRSEVVGMGKASWAGFQVGEVDIAVACSEKSRSATDVGKTNEHVSGNVRISRAFLMGHDRADGWIDRRSAGGAPGVDEVGSNGVFVDQAMIAGANCGDLFHALGELREMFADLNSFHCSVDGRIIGTRFEGLFRAALFFRIECIDLRSAAAEPDEDAMFCFAFWDIGNGAGSPGHAGEGAGGEKCAAIHGVIGVAGASCPVASGMGVCGAGRGDNVGRIRCRTCYAERQARNRA